MVETNANLLQIGIGNEEAITLKPAIVEVLEAKIEEVGVKKTNKVVCLCKHPDGADPIKISSVKYELKGKLDTAGLWVNLDSKKLLRKGSSLAVFLQFQGCQIVEQLKGKKIPTTTDDKGYLVFKAY